MRMLGWWSGLYVNKTADVVSISANCLRALLWKVDEGFSFLWLVFSGWFSQSRVFLLASISMIWQS